MDAMFTDRPHSAMPEAKRLHGSKRMPCLGARFISHLATKGWINETHNLRSHRGRGCRFWATGLGAGARSRARDARPAGDVATDPGEAQSQHVAAGTMGRRARPEQGR